MDPDRDLPQPLTDTSIDVRNLDGFLLNVERLLASELWALSSGAEFKAAVGLWSRAWKQIPAASVPNDDRVLASFSGAGVNWSKVKDMALRGFILCSDGRLYHKVLAEDAKRAYALKLERRARTEAATEARKKERNVHRNDLRNVERNDNVTSPIDKTRQDKTGLDLLKSSVSPSGDTAASPAKPETPLDLKLELWRRGLAFLASRGIAEAQARPLIGAWCKAIGPPDNEMRLIGILAEAEVNCLGDVIPWITAAIKRRKANGNGNHDQTWADRQRDIRRDVFEGMRKAGRLEPDGTPIERPTRKTS